MIVSGVGSGASFEYEVWMVTKVTGVIDKNRIHAVVMSGHICDDFNGE